jgi:hypothetical protein
MICRICNQRFQDLSCKWGICEKCQKEPLVKLWDNDKDARWDSEKQTKSSDKQTKKFWSSWSGTPIPKSKKPFQQISRLKFLHFPRK